MLIRLSNDQITEHWDNISKALEYSLPPTAEVSEEGLLKIFDLLLLEEMQAWYAYSLINGEAKVHAMAITTVWRDFATASKSLFIYALYGYTIMEESLWRESLEGLRAFAKAASCRRILAMSSVSRVLQLAERFKGNSSVRLISWEV